MSILLRALKWTDVFVVSLPNHPVCHIVTGGPIVLRLAARGESVPHAHRFDFNAHAGDASPANADDGES